MERRCISCNASLTNDTESVRFKCPVCGKEEVCRCSRCRKLGVKYTCKCGFEGP